MQQLFPNLAVDGFIETSDASGRYNCIAWAAGFDTRWWWPDPNSVSYWPESVSRQETAEAFVEAFATLRYVRCDDGTLEAGFEKIAIFVLDGRPTHAARQLADGMWTSKLGRSIDIAHTLRGLEGACYGIASIFMKRPRQ
jgi:hypothetical protein